MSLSISSGHVTVFTNFVSIAYVGLGMHPVCKHNLIKVISVKELRESTSAIYYLHKI